MLKGIAKLTRHRPHPRHLSAQGRLPSDGPAQGERQLSKIGVTQALSTYGAADFGKVP